MNILKLFVEQYKKGISVLKKNFFSFVSILSFFILCSFFTIPQAYGQDYKMQISTVTDKAGNKPSATFAIVEDHMGFIWF